MIPDPPAPGPWRLHVVPHTHWDREWYLPLEAFRIRLAHTVDEVVDVLERHPEMRFTLDGQAVILEDYEEHRPDPEARERLRAALASGRLAAGPAYIQPDELLVSGESLVRNLLVGVAVCRRHGAEPAAIGYAPDAFGHPAQMPQILRGFGLDHFIFMRGFGEDPEAAGAVLWWEGPDGSRVLAVPLLAGYASASSLGMEDGHGHWITDPGRWPQAAAARVAEVLGTLAGGQRAAGLADVLLCNGVDHRRIQRNLAEVLDACAERLPGTSYRICRYEDYLDAIRAQLPRLRLHTMRGEQVSGRHHTVTRSVNSTRLELKQANAAAERLLYSSEALAALASFRDDYDDPRETFELAWRHLLRAQPHDSICGCSVDQVHRDMRQRFDAAREIADRLGQEALVALGGLGREAIWHYAGAPAARRSVVNVLPWPRRRTIELELPPELAGAHALHARTDAGPVPVQLVGRGAEQRALVLCDLPALGAVTLQLAPGAAPAAAGAAVTGPRAIRNEALAVEVADDGSLVLTDRRTGRSWPGLHRFCDEGDRGDEYSFCPVEGEAPWSSAGGRAEVHVVEDGPLRAELEVHVALPLPAALSPDRRRREGHATCVALTRVRLDAGAERVELETRLVNRASDHRLRVLFGDPGGDPDRVRALSAFAVVERRARPPAGDGWYEPPAPTGDAAGMVCAGDLRLMTRGLPEYEARLLPGGGVELALTLLRAVGWLSRDDLTTRRGGAGPAVLTPDAQGLGERRCEYALAVDGAAGDAELVRATDDYRFELADGPGSVDLSGVLEVRGERFACSAVKGAEDGDGLILRVYNPGADPGWIEVGGAVRDVERCRLDESGCEPAPGRQVLGPYAIATLRVRPAAAARDPRAPHPPAIPGAPVPLG